MSTKTAAKNARTKTTASKALANGATAIFIPLNDGKHAYVVNGGQSDHLSTSSQAFIDAVRKLAAEGKGVRAHEELTAFAATYPTHGWDGVLSSLEAADAFAAA